MRQTMNRHSMDRITKIDVGTPPYSQSSCQSTKFQFHFHAFESLSTEKGHGIFSSKFQCFGHEWLLSLFPGGLPSAKAGFVSVGLLKSSKEESISVMYEFTVRDLNGDDVINDSNYETHEYHFGKTKFSRNFIRRSEIVESPNNILDEGALVVGVEMISLEKSSLPFRPYVPANNCRDKMDALWKQDSKYKDVLFVITRKNKGNPTPFDGDDATTSKYYAHRAILQACAPGLFELCEPYEQLTPIHLSNVTPHVFELLLVYVYGCTVSVAEWKEHSKELIDAADQYQISDLKLEAEVWYLKFNTITAENAIDRLLYADAKNCALLKERVMDYFVKNGEDALQLMSSEDIPKSSNWFTDLLFAMNANSDECESEWLTPFRMMRVCGLRRGLHNRGLEVDGSREVMVKRGEESDEVESTEDQEENAEDNE
mmetsp:Transcript_18742/g.39435  ORF Transcript_18742/g.39435 Transcript_18742/m.39435 type:complete len:428 (+) Transcript_18742:121-1404(+)